MAVCPNPTGDSYTLQKGAVYFPRQDLHAFKEKGLVFNPLGFKQITVYTPDDPTLGYVSSGDQKFWVRLGKVKGGRQNFFVTDGNQCSVTETVSLRVFPFLAAGTRKMVFGIGDDPDIDTWRKGLFDLEGKKLDGDKDDWVLKIDLEKQENLDDQTGKAFLPRRTPYLHDFNSIKNGGEDYTQKRLWALEFDGIVEDDLSNYHSLRNKQLAMVVSQDLALDQGGNVALRDYENVYLQEACVPLSALIKKGWFIPSDDYGNNEDETRDMLQELYDTNNREGVYKDMHAGNVGFLKSKLDTFEETFEGKNLMEFVGGLEASDFKFLDIDGGWGFKQITWQQWFGRQVWGQERPDALPVGNWAPQAPGPLPLPPPEHWTRKENIRLRF